MSEPTMGPWTQIWVRGERATPASMKMVDAQINNFGGFFAAPEGTPIQEADGTFEVRVLFGDPGFVKYLLVDRYHLTIVREETHDD
jgi:hypothetical protein